MQKPKDILLTISSAAAKVLQDEALNSQQRTFMNHIEKTTQQLITQVAEIPTTDYALQRILPLLGDSYEQQLSVIYGYTKMLLEHPASFDDTDLTESQRLHVQAIYDGGVLLAQQVHTLKTEAFEERKRERTGNPARFDMNMLIWQHIPICRYFINNDAVKLSVQLPQGLPPIFVNPYHFVGIVQHLIVTIANDLMGYGKIAVTANYADDCVTLQLVAEGLRLSDDVLQTLFVKSGRDAYQKRIEQQAMTLTIEPIPTLGTAINLNIPIAPRITT